MATNEANKELARSLLEQDVPIAEVVAKSGLNEATVRGLKGAMVKRLASRSQATQLKAKPSQAISKPESEFQAENQADPLEDETGGLHVPPVIPSGYVLKPALTPSEWKELAALDKGKLVALVADLKASNSSLQAQAVMPKGDGDERLSSYDEQLKRLEVERQKIQIDQDREYALSIREDRMRSRTGKGDSLGWKEVIEIVKLVSGSQKGSEPLSLKDSLEMAKFMSGSGTKETLQLVDYIQHAQKEGQAVTLNDIALKLEDMKQHGDLENRKLDFEVKKWERQEDKGDATVELIKDGIKAVTSGPVGDAIKNIGAGAADRLRGGPRVSMAKAKCPNCSASFSANPELPQIMCPSCGIMLAKGSSPQPQQEQPTEPAKEESKPKDETVSEATVSETEPVKRESF